MAPLQRRGREAAPEPESPSAALGRLERRWQDHIARAPWTPSRDRKVAELRAKVAGLDARVEPIVAAVLAGQAPALAPPLDELAELWEEVHAFVEAARAPLNEVYFFLAQLSDVAWILDEAARLQDSVP